MRRLSLRNHPVIVHVAKIAAFGSIQALLMIGLSRATTESSRVAGETTYLDTLLQNKLYSYWRQDRNLFDTLFKPGSNSRPAVQGVVKSLGHGSDQYLAAIKDKNRLAREAPGHRMFWVGGSGLAFGLDSELLAQRYDYHPVNLGLHARLNLDFMLRQAGATARPGDIVVLAIEYTVMRRARTRMTDQRRRDVLRIAPELESYFATAFDETSSWGEKWQSVKGYADERALAEAATGLRGQFSLVYEQVFSDDSIAETSLGREFLREYTAHRGELLATLGRLGSVKKRIHRRSGFNEYGDLTTHRHLPTEFVPQTKSENLFPSPGHETTNQHMVRNLKRVQKFVKECEERQIRVYFSYPPLYETDGARPFAVHYAALVERHLDIPIVNTIEDMIFDPEYFFNSPRHLTWAGTCLRMREITAGLDRLLETDSPLRPAAHVAARDRAVRGKIVASISARGATR